jgi:hypothetical protein
MTVRDGSAEWHDGVESGSGTITVGNRVFHGAHACASQVQLRNLDGAISPARIDLDTEGDVPDIDERQFQAHAEAAKRDCPDSLGRVARPGTRDDNLLGWLAS